MSRHWPSLTAVGRGASQATTAIVCSCRFEDRVTYACANSTARANKKKGLKKEKKKKKKCARCAVESWIGTGCVDKVEQADSNEAAGEIVASAPLAQQVNTGACYRAPTGGRFFRAEHRDGATP